MKRWDGEQHGNVVLVTRLLTTIHHRFNLPILSVEAQGKFADGCMIG